MENIIVIINAADIPAAVQIAQTLASYRVYTFDPILLDRITNAGFSNAQLIIWDDCPLYVDLDAQANRDVYALEAELDVAVRNIIPDISIAGWQHLNLYYFLMMTYWYRSLWEHVGAQFDNHHVHLLICDTPAEYYFNSYIPSLLLANVLTSRGIEFVAYNYGEKAEQADLVPDFSGLNAVSSTAQLLTHLPTCMYDIHYFHQEILESGFNIINIEARNFNIPIPAHNHRALLKSDTVALGNEQQATLNTFEQILVEKLDVLFKQYIASPRYRVRQVRYLARLYRSQLMTYYLLNQYFELQKPTKILLSDHDAGFHGPIISFAARHALPVLLVPHSKTSAHIEFSYRNIVALTHPMQSHPIVDAKGRQVLRLSVSYPETFSASSVFPRPMQTVSLLLNALSLNGIYFTRNANYLDGIKRILSWCNEHEVELRIRCKPSYSIMTTLINELKMDAAMLTHNAKITMEEHVRECDVCLMYDTPTSGVLHCLKNAIPTLNPIVSELTSAQLTMANPDLVCPESIDATLLKLQAFKDNPLNLFDFRNKQFYNYIAHFQSARALRTYL